MERKIIGIDFDDCLFDCGTRMCEFHNEAYCTALRRDDVKSLQLEHAWDCTPEEVIRRVEEFYWTHHHDAMHPMDGAVDALSALSRRAKSPEYDLTIRFYEAMGFVPFVELEPEPGDYMMWMIRAL